MAGAIIIVVVLLLIPVVVLMTGGIAAAILGPVARAGCRGAPRGQRAARSRRLIPAVHRRNEAMAELTQAIVEYATERVQLEPPPLDGPRTLAELRAAAGETITPDGIGGLEALRIFGDVLAPACISVDHPRFLSFVPAAPTEAAILFDLVVGASSIYGGSWLEGGGAVFAENEALRWIADLAGMPAAAGGVFVSGGTAGNLSALIAARWRWRQRAGGAHDRTRGLLLAVERRPFVRRPGGAGDGRRCRQCPRRRRWPAQP